MIASRRQFLRRAVAGACLVAIVGPGVVAGVRESLLARWRRSREAARRRAARNALIGGGLLAAFVAGVPMYRIPKEGGR